MRRTLSIFALFLPAFALQARAFQEATYGMQAANYGAGALIASPPLPMLYMKAGMSRFSIQPGYVSGGIDSISGSPSGEYETQGSFSGLGGALAYNHALADSLGYFVMGMGDQVTGDFSYRSTSCTPYCSSVDTKGIRAAFYSAAIGLNWTFMGGSPDSAISAGIFLGPSLTAATLTQRVAATDSSGALTDDFEMKTAPTFATAVIGVQLGIRFGDYLIVNPYAMTNVNLNDDPCQSYEVTGETVHGTLAGQSTPTCGGATTGVAATTNHKIDVRGNFGAVGINLMIPHLGISMSVYTVPNTPSDVTMKGLKVNAYVLALSFGH